MNYEVNYGSELSSDVAYYLTMPHVKVYMFGPDRKSKSVILTMAKAYMEASPVAFRTDVSDEEIARFFKGRIYRVKDVWLRASTITRVSDGNVVRADLDYRTESSGGTLSPGEFVLIGTGEYAGEVESLTNEVMANTELVVSEG